VLKLLQGAVGSLANRPGRAARGHAAVSLAVAVFNRPTLVIKALARPLRDPRIDDIVVHDDGSAPDQFEIMARNLRDLSPKIRIQCSRINEGPLHAKFRAVEGCRNPWVILLDSDNAIERAYVNAIFALERWDEDTIYCPDFARPHFDFRTFDGQRIDLAAARRLLLAPNRRQIMTLLNTGNYFLNRARYLSALSESVRYRINAVDVLAANYMWLRTGGVLELVHGMSYQHLVHPDSHYRSFETAGRAAGARIRNAIVDRTAVELADIVAPRQSKVG
jgi:glycosyltransferase involved in cell wall biosynthesis